MTDAMTRAGALGAIGAFVLAPGRVRAEDTRKFRCHVRVEREPDHKETRLVEVTVPDGKTVQGIDGDRDFKTSPPTVMGLRADVTAKAAGDTIALHVKAVYRTWRVTIVAGQTIIGTSVEVTAELAAGEKSATPMDVYGVPYTLTVWAEPA